MPQKGSDKPTEEISANNVVSNLALNHIEMTQEKVCNSKKWHRVQRWEKEQILNPAKWILEGCEQIGKQVFTVGFEVLERKKKGTRNQSLMIEEIQDEELSPLVNEDTVQHGSVQSSKIQESVECSGSKNKRVLEGKGKDVGLSSQKKKQR